MRPKKFTFWNREVLSDEVVRACMVYHTHAVDAAG